MPCRELLDCKEMLELQVFRAHKVELDHQEHRVLPEIMGNQEIKVHVNFSLVCSTCT